jgi:hypothetical protein
MKISLSATACFFLLALCCETTLAQDLLGTYKGRISTAFNDQIIPAQETKVILGDRLVDASGASNPSCGSFPPESNRFNLKVEPVFLLRRAGEIQFVSAAAPLVGSTSGTVLQYWCICDSTTQANCGACYPDDNLPPPTPFPPDAIRGCLVDTHETETNPPNLLAVSKSGFVAPMIIQKKAILTGTIVESLTLPRLELNIKGTTVFGDSFTSEVKVTKVVP